MEIKIKEKSIGVCPLCKTQDDTIATRDYPGGYCHVSCYNEMIAMKTPELNRRMKVLLWFGEKLRNIEGASIFSVIYSTFLVAVMLLISLTIDYKVAPSILTRNFNSSSR